MSINDYRRRVDPPTRVRFRRKTVGFTYQCTQCKTRKSYLCPNTKWAQPVQVSAGCPCGGLMVFLSTGNRERAKKSGLDLVELPALEPVVMFA